MSTIKVVPPSENIAERDIWFYGKSVEGPNGKPNFFICEHLDNHHYDEETQEFYPYCKHKKLKIEEAGCGMECDQYGYCKTCRGFSAVRCQECDILR